MIDLLKNTVFFVFVVSNISLFAQVQPGAHQTDEYLPLLIGKQVGVVGNQSSLVIIDEKKVHLIDHLIEQGVDISKVFAPEHGFRGKDDAGALISKMKLMQKLVFTLFHSMEKHENQLLNTWRISMF